MIPTRTVVVNLVLFQAGWLACVAGAAAGLPWPAVLAAAAVVAIHLRSSPDRLTEVRFVAAVTAIGAVVDTLFAANGLLVYASPVPSPGLAPVWIVALWALFATTLNVSLRWLRGRPLLAALFGAIGGPLAYYGGSALGGVELASGVASLLALSAAWAVLTPALVAFARRADGWRELAGVRAPATATGAGA